MGNYKKLFGTDGVRGVANVEPVTSETALKLGRAAAHVFRTRAPVAKGHGRHKIVVGKDTRLSGYMMENAISAGILSMGVDVLLIGPLPTPGVAYTTRSLRAAVKTTTERSVHASALPRSASASPSLPSETAPSEFLLIAPS